MAKPYDSLSWAATDEENLLGALEIYGLGRWEEVAKSTRCKTASEAERFFKERYPIAPTNSTTLSPQYFLEDIDFNVTDASLFTARWGVHLRRCRKHGRGHGLEVRVPDSWAPADVRRFEDHRSYFGEDPSEAESHFKKRYPQSPTHPVLLPNPPLRQYADARRTVAEGAVSARRWIVNWHKKREFPDRYMPEVNVPASLSPKDVKKYEDDKKYVGDYVTVTAVSWFITTKIDNDFVEVRIPVWQLPAKVSVWGS